MTTARSITSLIALLLACVLAFSANIGVWIDRTVYDTEGFVTTTKAVFDDPDVQQVIAREIADTLIREGNLEVRLQEQLPPGLGFLALPLTENLADFVERITLRVLQSETFDEVYVASLTALHGNLIRVIETSDVLGVEGGQLVIDLRPILAKVLEEIGLEEVDLEGEGILATLDLPETAGQYVVEDTAARWIYWIAKYGDDAVRYGVLAAFAAFALSIVVAPSRRSAIGRSGLGLVAVGFLSIVALVPVNIISSNLTDDGEAMISVIGILSEPLRMQSLMLIGVGFLFALAAFLAGDSRIATAVRDSMRGKGHASAGSFAQEFAVPLRVAGIAGVILLMLIWPDPTTRVQISLLILLAAYLAVLWVFTGGSPWAVALHDRAETFRTQYFSPPTAAEAGWVARRANWLRVVGVVAAIVAIVFVPTLNTVTFISIVLMFLAWIAGIEWLTGRSQQA